MSQGDFQVGEWKVYPQRNRMQCGSADLRLEPKVMQMLVELATHAGQVLSKDELIQSIWPEVNVSEASLTRCISELRHALNDDPHSPHVIETINKQGYRLMLPVVFEPTPMQEPPASVGLKDEAAFPTPPPPASPALVAPSSVTRRINWIVSALAILLITASSLAWRVYSRPTYGYKRFRIVPFTAYSGRAHSPSFSPDGNQIAFIWDGGAEDNSSNVYVKLIGSEPPLRITSTSDAKYNPAWSPNGRWIAFLRQSVRDSGIFLVPVIGGEERQVYRLHGTIDSDSPGLSWSPDGKKIVFSDGKTEEGSAAIYSLSLETYESVQLTHPDNSWDGDMSPAYSPDGKTIAFVRGADIATRNIYIMDASGSNVRQLTFGQRQKYGLAWAVDGKHIIFSCDEGATKALWQVPVQGGDPERLPFGTENAIDPAVSPSGDRLAYAEGSATWSMLQLDLAHPDAPPVTLVSSMTQDSAPKWSPDGQHIAYQSTRSGAQEIWISDGHGMQPIRLTSFDGPLTGSPSWSPDGQQIAFDTRVNDHSHIFVMSADGRNKRELTSGPFNDVIPNWSRDGQWIYFGAKRTDRWQIWKISTTSGQVVQVTRDGGFVAAESPDGRWVYYTKYALPGLWRQPVSGGNEEFVLQGPLENYWESWCFSHDGIYFVNKAGDRWSVQFLANGTTKPIQVLQLRKQPPMFSSLSVSSDKRWVLISDQSSSSINIQVVGGLR